MYDFTFSFLQKFMISLFHLPAPCQHNLFYCSQIFCLFFHFFWRFFIHLFNSTDIMIDWLCICNCTKQTIIWKNIFHLICSIIKIKNSWVNCHIKYWFGYKYVFGTMSRNNRIKTFICVLCFAMKAFYQ